jgi:hypothetical protein
MARLFAVARASAPRIADGGQGEELVTYYESKLFPISLTPRANSPQAWTTLSSAASSPSAKAALNELERACFANALLALGAQLVHRLEGAEGKCGNPLNEVRMLCNAMIGSGAVPQADKGIKYNPTKAVLKCELGQPVQLGAASFATPSRAFVLETERKYA